MYDIKGIIQYIDAKTDGYGTYAICGLGFAYGVALATGLWVPAALTQKGIEFILASGGLLRVRKAMKKGEVK